MRHPAEPAPVDIGLRSCTPLECYGCYGEPPETRAPDAVPPQFSSDSARTVESLDDVYFIFDGDRRKLKNFPISLLQYVPHQIVLVQALHIIMMHPVCLLFRRV